MAGENTSGPVKRHAVPSAVGKAIRYMQRNLGNRVSVAEIAAAAEVSERTLRRQFKRFLRKSPNAFHRDLRLEAADRALNANGHNLEVTAAALNHGFSHFGQFAAHYRQRFGKLPSETRRAKSTLIKPASSSAVQDRVVVAVLQFASANEAGQAAFAALLTETLLSTVGGQRWIDAITDDTSTVQYRARYHLLGRVNAVGTRLLVTVRLVESATARHVWGNAFDGDSSDPLSLLRHVAESVGGTLPSCLRGAEADRIARKPSQERSIDELVMRAFVNCSALTSAANSRAMEDLYQALVIFPEHALALALSSWCRAQRAIYNFGGTLHSEREEARRLACMALALDGEDSQVLAVLGTASTQIGDLDLAELLVEKCLAIDPRNAMAWQRRGWIATYRGGTDTALANFRQCTALDPHSPDRHNTMFGISTAQFQAGRYDKAADWALRGIRERPSALWAYRIAAVAQARCGRLVESRRSAALLLRHYPDLTVSAVSNAMPNQPEFLARFAEGLETAGVPV